jgi:hypothetical protein
MTRPEEPQPSSDDRPSRQRMFRRVGFIGFAVCLAALVVWFVSRSSLGATGDGRAIEVWTLIVAGVSGVGALLSGLAAMIAALRPTPEGQRTRPGAAGSPGSRRRTARNRHRRPRDR